MAAAVDVVRPPPSGLVVLTYHRVGAASGTEVDLPIEVFTRQLDHLAMNASVLTLDEAVARLARTQTEEQSIVVITFDDGTADFVDVAFPVLAERRLPVTLYLATDFIDRRRPFPHDGQPVSWEALRDASSTGLVDVGSHTHTHALLDRLSAAEVADELDRSVTLIGERLGRQVRHFAYPKGVSGSPAAELAIRERFVSAALGGGGPNPFGATDVYRLARTPIQVADGMRWFTRKVRGGLRFEDAVRKLINRRRYADSIT